ncbi:MAG: hypothetical protein H7Y32_14010, partial [Chloroflexales bacterium]|nr:hypothetical protein [Chloroflexales bacterium]
IFAFHGAAPDAVPAGEGAGGVVAPIGSSAQYIQPDLRVAIWRTQPEIEGDAPALAQRLADILDRVHAALTAHVAVRCHGVFLDALSANAHGALASVNGLLRRDGTALADDLEDLLVCPKPHIAPWRVDLVSHTRDCCANATLCHIKHRPHAGKPQRLTALDEIAAAISSGSAFGDEAAVAEAATSQVLAITKRYAQLLQPDIAHYRQWVSDELDVGDRFETTALLNGAQRETLALARFLWEQIEYIKASNFAGPTLLFTGVLEELTRATIYQRSPPLYDADTGRALMLTLGTLGNSKGHGGTNWTILEQSIVLGGCWHAQVSPQQLLAFSSWIDMIKTIGYIRNDAAHKANVERKAFQRLIALYFGSPVSGIGVFNGLLLAWQ